MLNEIRFFFAAKLVAPDIAHLMDGVLWRKGVNLINSRGSDLGHFSSLKCSKNSPHRASIKALQLQWQCNKFVVTRFNIRKNETF
ncbi:hypothetical protein SAMN06296036_106104 [Pseudobacteriovorax antillogorgiicola]|uniref:Uncharacterized protein n=1 Tax=Pseudobacteriovorax antillogorgiicola TaxID=1513793 RepID=A0A1Y6BLW9_9BACT|nr:hypothetical protein EDD56_106139 [Pseudobacteriovorax antillogorgiicola]SMF17234.1 hypothetical protein SAMN06296036_106104 [Pseudobacteriovorax antillogorgiicola]